MKIGVFGGTFNPIHVAHVQMAEAYTKMLGLSKLLLMPAYIPPHKKPKGLARAEDRLAMCRMATTGVPLFELCDYEIRQEGKSYTFKTLQHLHGQDPDAELYLIMGADMFLTVQDWRQPQEIFRLATLCAAERRQGELTLLQAHRKLLERQGARCVILDMEPTPLASTDIREGIRTGQDVAKLLHPAVLDYIREKRLYLR